MEIETDRLMDWISYDDDPSKDNRALTGHTCLSGSSLLRDIFSIRTLLCKFDGASFFAIKLSE